MSKHTQKMIKDLDITPDTGKFLDENIGESVTLATAIIFRL
jgi:hypothetical protein